MKLKNDATGATSAEVRRDFMDPSAVEPLREQEYIVFYTKTIPLAKGDPRGRPPGYDNIERLRVDPDIDPEERAIYTRLRSGFLTVDAFVFPALTKLGKPGRGFIADVHAFTSSKSGISGDADSLDVWHHEKRFMKAVDAIEHLKKAMDVLDRMTPHQIMDLPKNSMGMSRLPGA